MTYLHTKQYSKKSNKASARYRPILWGGVLLPNGSQGCVDPTSPNLGRTYCDHHYTRSLFQSLVFSNVGGSKLSDSQVMLKTTPNFALFDPPPPPVKIHLMAIYCAASERVGLIKKEVHG